MRTVSELEAAMATKYDGPVDVVNKGSGERTYIPWPAMCRHLDKVFGWDGWGARVVAVVPDEAHDCYTVALDLEIYVWDERAKCIRTIPRPGVSGALVRERGDASDVPTSARSLALVNAGRTLGDAFGLYLTPDKSGGNGHSGGSEEQASDAQKQTLRKCHVPENLVRVATKAQASGFFDRIFADKKTGAYKFGRKFTNEEAIAAVWGESAVEASDDLPIPQF